MNRLIRWGTLAVMVAVPVAADAQAAVGFRAGVRNAGIDAGQDLSTISAPVYGAYLGVGLSNRLALQAELVYGVRGAAGLGLGTEALDATAVPVRLEMEYLEAPLLLRTGFPGQRILTSVFAGPYVGFLLSCEATPDGGIATACNDAAATRRFTPQNTDFGLVVGAGVDLAIGESTVFVDGRYTIGIRSIQSGGDAFDARHNGLAISGGFAVPLGR